jgi:four helix bundle protein
MATFKKFEDIEAWKKARLFCNKIFLITTTTELYKDFKLKEQINGSSGSIMDNIAEGFGRGGNSEFMQFLEYANASACEAQFQLYRISDRNYINKNTFEELYKLVEEIKSMIIGLINYLQKSEFRGVKFKGRIK